MRIEPTIMISEEPKDRFSKIIQEIYNFTDYYYWLVKLNEEGKGLKLNLKNNGISYIPDLKKTKNPFAALRLFKF